MSKKKNKSLHKMNDEALQGLLHFRSRKGIVPAKKGKGSYNRKNFKKVSDET